MIHDILVAQRDIQHSSHQGFAFLAATAAGWLICGLLARFTLRPRPAALVILFQGVVSIPAAFLLEHLLGFPAGDPNNPLTPLAVFLAVSQSIAMPAVLFVYFERPERVPAAMAAIVGAHFLPYAWLQQAPVYAVLGVVTAWAPFIAARRLGERSLWVTPLFVGTCLAIAAFAVW